MSEVSATRPGGAFSALRRRPPVPGGAAARGVRTTPGATAFTSTPRGPGSTAAERTNAVGPASPAPDAECRGRRVGEEHPGGGAARPDHGGTLRQI